MNADLIIRNARIEGRPALADIAISAGTIARVARQLAGDGLAEQDVGGQLVSPAFVEPHIHLDKAGTLPLLGRNRSGTLAEAIDILHRIKRSSSADEVAARAGTVIRQAVLSGTTRIRSHVDVDTVGGLTPLRGVLQAASEHADICDIQTVPPGGNRPRPRYRRPDGCGDAGRRRRSRRYAALGDGRAIGT